MLLDIAIDSGAIVDFNADVSALEPEVSEEKYSVKLTTGETICADLVIGADGVRSTVRQILLGHDELPQPGDFTGYSSVHRSFLLLETF